MAPTHHCAKYEASGERNAIRGRILLTQERALRLLLAYTEPTSDEEEYLDENVLECVTCYRELLVEVAGQFSASNAVLFGSLETSIESLQYDLEAKLRMATENRMGQP